MQNIIITGGAGFIGWNLANKFLEKNYKVLFVEADIRRPSVLNSFYKFDKEIYGLGEIISSKIAFKDTLFTVPGTKLKIITSGAKRFDMSDIVSKDQIKTPM